MKTKPGSGTSTGTVEELQQQLAGAEAKLAELAAKRRLDRANCEAAQTEARRLKSKCLALRGEDYPLPRYQDQSLRTMRMVAHAEKAELSPSILTYSATLLQEAEAELRTAEEDVQHRLRVAAELQGSYDQAEQNCNRLRDSLRPLLEADFRTKEAAFESLGEEQTRLQASIETAPISDLPAIRQRLDQLVFLLPVAELAALDAEIAYLAVTKHPLEATLRERRDRIQALEQEYKKVHRDLLIARNEIDKVQQQQVRDKERRLQLRNRREELVAALRAGAASKPMRQYAQPIQGRHDMVQVGL